MSTADKVFMMGEYEASFPVHLLYGKNHMWASPVPLARDETAQNETAHYEVARADAEQDDANQCVLRLGLSAYAVRLLQDVYFLDLDVEPGMQLKARQEIGSIESKKAESSLYTPIAGQVTTVNERLLEDPTAINLDKYGQGWLYELKGTTDGLLDCNQYLEHLDAAWEVAQRTIKGQANA